MKNIIHFTPDVIRYLTNSLIFVRLNIEYSCILKIILIWDKVLFYINKTSYTLSKKRRVYHVWLYLSHVKINTQVSSGECHADQGLFDLKIIQGEFP